MHNRVQVVEVADHLGEDPHALDARLGVGGWENFLSQNGLLPSWRDYLIYLLQKSGSFTHPQTQSARTMSPVG